MCVGIIHRINLTWSDVAVAATCLGLWVASRLADEPYDGLCVLLSWVVFGAYLTVDIARKLRNARPRY